MTVAHGILLLIAVIMGAESLWAIGDPSGMRARIGKLLGETEEEKAAGPVPLWIAALLIWAAAWFGQQWAHRTLFLIGVVLMGLGILAQRHRFAATWYRWFLGNRSDTMVRLIYCAELGLAALFGWIAVRGL